MIFGDFARAFQQLGDRKFLLVLAMSVGLSLALLAGFCALVIWGLSGIIPDQFTLPGGLVITWVGTALTGTSLVALLFLSSLLMVPVATAFTGLFLDSIVDAVEARHYGHIPSTPPLGIGTTMIDSINFLGLVLLLNTLALVVYFLSGPFAPVLFILLNGYLLGREYFQLVAARRMSRDGAKASRRKNRYEVWFAGILMVIPLSIPIINLFVPLLAVATFTHLFHRVQNQDRSA
ncbi:MAG: hypothetical protein ACJA1E_000412 [Paracoccaceae bacterium]